MSLETSFARLINQMESVRRLVRRLTVRQNNLIREATVKEVDYQRGLAVVDAHGVETKMVPWLERAGDIVEWNPLSKGQRVVLFSPDGDLGRAFILPGGFTDAVPQPDNRGAHRRIKIGGAIITHSAAGLLIDIDGATFEFSANGLEMSVGGSNFRFTGAGFAQSGGSQSHDGKNVGSDHVHTNVMAGPSNTGPPP